MAVASPRCYSTRVWVGACSCARALTPTAIYQQVAWHGQYVPYKYPMAAFAAVGAVKVNGSHSVCMCLCVC